MFLAPKSPSYDNFGGTVFWMHSLSAISSPLGLASTQPKFAKTSHHKICLPTVPQRSQTVARQCVWCLGASADYLSPLHPSKNQRCQSTGLSMVCKRKR